MQRKLLGALLCCIGALNVQAEDVIPCLIFSGESGEEYALDLSKYNRITFGKNSMVVSNSKDPDTKVELLYSAYHHLVVGNAKVSGVETPITNDFALVYDRDTSTLRINSSYSETYTVGVFNVNGILVYQTETQGDATLSLESLGGGIYIAIAVGKENAQKIKFVK